MSYTVQQYIGDVLESRRRPAVPLVQPMTLTNAVAVLNAYEHAGYQTWVWGEMPVGGGRLARMAFPRLGVGVEPSTVEAIESMSEREAIATVLAYVDGDADIYSPPPGAAKTPGGGESLPHSKVQQA